MKGLFVTGTDTDCGKTRVAVALIHRLRGLGLRVAPFKPVAAGAERTPGGLRNRDALQLIEAAGGGWAYDRVNPYCFEAAQSPHLAAADTGLLVEGTVIRQACEQLAADADLVVVEGAGGWLAPLRADWYVEDLALLLGLPVVLVVGLRLGCLNHALLSARAVAGSGAELLGWVGSTIDPAMLGLEANIQTLTQSLPATCLGVLPWLQADEDGAACLDETLLARICSG